MIRQDLCLNIVPASGRLLESKAEALDSVREVAATMIKAGNPQPPPSTPRTNASISA